MGKKIFSPLTALESHIEMVGRVMECQLQIPQDSQIQFTSFEIGIISSKMHFNYALR